MKNDRSGKDSKSSSSTSRVGKRSGRYYSFLDETSSVFSRSSFYDDMISIHPWSRRPRSRHSGIPFPALSSASCSSRLDVLARPKVKREQHIRQEYLDNYLNYAYTGVAPSALTANCSSSLAALARPKHGATSQNNTRPPPQQASGNDARAQPSDRNNPSAKPRRK